jgi:TonB family protein
MALRALLFSADSAATSVLCEILTELSMEAEICSEMLVAVERLSRESYDAILVDWEQETEAAYVLKSAREQRAPQALNLALVRNDKDVSRALQQGANTVIKKPIDPQAAHDTWFTARDLILSRRTEQKEKEARVAAIRAETAATDEEIRDKVPDGRKTGFLAQTAPRSAFEAQTGATTESVGDTQPGWQAARGPDALREDSAQVQEIRPAEKRRWDDSKPLAKAYQAPVDEPAPAIAPTRDSTGIFSSLPEEESAETEVEPKPKPHSQRVGFLLVACLLVVGVFYVWAPGDSYGGHMASLRNLFSSFRKPSVTPGPAAVSSSATALPEPAPQAKPDDPPEDPGPIATTEVDPSKIQIIETKVIPKAGAQVPTSGGPATSSDPAGSDSAQPQGGGAFGDAPAAGDAPSQPASVPQETRQISPQDQPRAAGPVQTKPTPPPALVPVAQPRIFAPVPSSRSAAATSGERVVIPDSLKTAPSPGSANGLDLSAIPEETSQGWVVHRVDPDYPAEALQQRLEGPVVLQAWVGKDGTVQDVKLLKGYFILGRAAFAAVKQWRFKPYVPGGKPIDFQTNITINFKYPG